MKFSNMGSWITAGSGLAGPWEHWPVPVYMVHPGPMRARIRSWFDGAGWFVGLAAALFVFALLVVGLEAQLPESLLWTGHRVIGTEQGGIVRYRWDGQSYALDAPGYGSSKAVSVYLNPGDPNNGMLDNTADRALVVLLVGGPAAGGVTLLAVGLTRKYRWRRRRLRQEASSGGHGLDPDFVARQLRELRGAPNNDQ
jgi:hypothetical protein